MKRTVLLSAFAALLLPLPVFALTATVNGVAWTYFVENDEVVIDRVPQGTSGLVSIPSRLPSGEGYNVPVTRIGYGAFQDCDRITSIAIPNSVTQIEEAAFQSCDELASITIPNSVTSIGNSAFQYCSSLASITIPDSVTRFGSSVFSGCDQLVKVTAPPKWGQKFRELNLPLFSIPDGVTVIDDDAFRDCYRFSRIAIPDSVVRIGNRAFQGCNGLTSITIPNGVVIIGEAAFGGCDGLTSITIPESVTSIGVGAFECCSGLTSVRIPDSVTSIGDNAFSGCDGLIRVTAAPKWGQCFKRLSLQSFTISDGVTSIDDNAFEGCNRFERIAIPDSLVSIGNFAFSDCHGLTSLAIPGGVINIGDYTFGRCDGLTSLVIPDGVTSIGSNAFYDCSDLETLLLPLRFKGNTETLSIPSGCTVTFHGFCNLTVRSEFGTPDPGRGLRTIEVFDPTLVSCRVNGTEETGVPGVRRFCTGWTGTGSVPSEGRGTNAVFSIDADSSITWNWRKENRISVSVAGCGECNFGTRWIADGETATAQILPSTDLFRLELSGDADGVTVDGTTLSIPSDRPREIVATITETSPFTWTANDDGETCTITGRLRQDAGVVIPEEIEGLVVTRIGDAAFSGDAALVSVVVPDGVEYIGEDAFRDCTSLESVSILDPDTRVRNRAFYGCTSLKRLTIPGEYNRREEWDDPWSEGNERGYAGNNEIFETLQGGGYWGYTQETIEEIFVTPGSQRIGGRAFCSFTSCTNVVIPDSVASIEYDAFCGCTGLASVVIPDSVTSIEYEAFCGCTGLESVVIPESVTSIGQGAFMGCFGLTSVRISDSVTSIGLGAFDECADELFDTESIPGVKLVDGWAAGHTDSLSGALDLSGIRGIVGGASLLPDRPRPGCR